MNGRLEWPDPTPDGPTPEEERQMDLARECQTCDGNGRVEVFACNGICECGHCPDLKDCPECCGHEPVEDDNKVWNSLTPEEQQNEYFMGGSGDEVWD